jgi:hypothetical protein
MSTAILPGTCCCCDLLQTDHSYACLGSADSLSGFGTFDDAEFAGLYLPSARMHSSHFEHWNLGMPAESYLPTAGDKSWLDFQSADFGSIKLCRAAFAA